MNKISSKGLTKSFKKGFTLIELLVVVAIIGILASVVLASLNTARTKGSDAAVKGSLSNMRGQAAIYYDNNSNSYGSGLTACTGGVFSDPTIVSAIANITSTAAAAPNCYVNTAGSSYAMAALLKGNGTFCIDSTGNAKVLSTGTSSTVTATANSTTNAIFGTAATTYICQ